MEGWFLGVFFIIPWSSFALGESCLSLFLDLFELRCDFERLETLLIDPWFGKLRMDAPCAPCLASQSVHDICLVRVCCYLKATNFIVGFECSAQAGCDDDSESESDDEIFS
jgi:hypothetical protein